jgi:hypothetical protein
MGTLRHRSSLSVRAGNESFNFKATTISPIAPASKEKNGPTHDTDDPAAKNALIFSRNFLPSAPV